MIFRTWAVGRIFWFLSHVHASRDFRRRSRYITYVDFNDVESPSNKHLMYYKSRIYDTWARSTFEYLSVKNFIKRQFVQWLLNILNVPILVLQSSLLFLFYVHVFSSYSRNRKHGSIFNFKGRSLVENVL